MEDLGIGLGWTMFNAAYHNKRVLITGHTGFKGSWLALWLSQMGAQVVGYALQPPTEPNHFQFLLPVIMYHYNENQMISESIPRERVSKPLIFHEWQHSTDMTGYDQQSNI